MKILITFFLLGLFISPFVFWPKLTPSFEIPRVWFIQRWIEGLALLTFLNLKLIKKRRRDNLLAGLVGLFVLTAVFSSLFGIDLLKSIYGNYYRGDGLLTIFHLMGLFLFLLLFWDENWLKPTFKSISFGAFLISLWTIGWALKLHFFYELGTYSFNGAMAVSFGQPNFLAGYLLVCLPFLTYFFLTSKRKGQKIFWLLALVSQFLAIGLTFSRAGILGIFLFGLGWLTLDHLPSWWQKFSHHKKTKYILAVFLFFILVAGLFNYYRPDSSVYFPESRKRILAKSALAFLKRPLLGWGWANYDYAFKAVNWPYPYPVRFEAYVDKAHSHLLEVATTTGILGLGIYLAIIWQALKKLSQKMKQNLAIKTITLSFLLFLFHSQTNIISIAEELIFWLILGIVGQKKLV